MKQLQNIRPQIRRPCFNIESCDHRGSRRFPDLAGTGRSSRRGITLVETAIVLNVFLLLILGTLDLGIATYRYNTLSQAARNGARQAAVHGALAAPALAAWGPGTYSGTAGDGSQQALA